MKPLVTTLVTLALSGAAFAGPYIAPVEKNPIMVDPSCPCFAPGFQVGVFASGVFGANSLGNEYAGNPVAGAPAADGDDALGAGVSLSYFFTERIGLDYSYAWHSTRSDRHMHTMDLIYRRPLGYSCFAPYILGGGGVNTNGSSKGIYRAGGGIEYRMPNRNCSAIFADYIYNWTAGGDEGWNNDFSQARVGMRFQF